jgi:hypothetical protein
MKEHLVVRYNLDMSAREEPVINVVICTSFSSIELENMSICELL